MYIADDVHKLLGAAETATIEVQRQLDKCKKIANVLELIIIAKEVGLYRDVLDLVVNKKEDILSVDFASLQDRLNLIRTNLATVSEKVPNTTPPHPGGLESYSEIELK